MATVNSNTTLLESAFSAVSSAFNTLSVTSSCMDGLADMFNAIHKLSAKFSTALGLAGIGKHLSEDWSNIFDSEREDVEAVYGSLRERLNKTSDSKPEIDCIQTDDATLLDSARKATLSSIFVLRKSETCMDKLAGVFKAIAELSSSGDTAHSLAETGKYLSDDWSELLRSNLKEIDAALLIFLSGLSTDADLDASSCPQQADKGSTVDGSRLALEELRAASVALKTRYGNTPEGWAAAFAERDAILAKITGLSGAKNSFEHGFVSTLAEFVMSELEGAGVNLGDWVPEAAMTPEERSAQRNQQVSESVSDEIGQTA